MQGPSRSLHRRHTTASGSSRPVSGNADRTHRRGGAAMIRTREEILQEVLYLLSSVVQDWEFDGALDANTRLFADLAFESLDLVVLGAKIQEHFGQSFPFPQLFAE